MTTPWQRYQADLQREDFSHDPAQENAVRLLQDLHERLIARYRAREGGLVAWWARLRGRRREPETGLYLGGGVGRGKTYLVDTFFDCLPFQRKLRVHFHRFMRDGDPAPLVPILHHNVLDLVTLAADPELHVIPALASTWTKSQDGRTYTFRLRPDVRFHDGKALTADDVVFSFEVEDNVCVNEIKLSYRMRSWSWNDDAGRDVRWPCSDHRR